MEWASVINNPLLRDLPFKIELNKWGQIVMSPASNRHGQLQYEVGKVIDGKKGSGKIIMECSIDTPDGVKVADVAWVSDAFLERFDLQTPYPQAPEICVEVVSPSTSRGEIEEKIQLYLGQGAHEVWVVSEEGNARYYSSEGEMAESDEINRR